MGYSFLESGLGSIKDKQKSWTNPDKVTTITPILKTINITQRLKIKAR
ncbi:hypothetical protein PCC8801_3297 [Rippkaea orientalis PCC 8801]|uniref:Uncharacterized protein n=1 Tax=Rippkaea orientalis (strain PCC 8801 / RF-1) TaxID=41431 RepID=B7JZ57_RIPO1|nr:hypothetical protein PCC8801_3297 [Rippkaea orientalis PCC 8801]